MGFVKDGLFVAGAVAAGGLAAGAVDFGILYAISDDSSRTDMLKGSLPAAFAVRSVASTTLAVLPAAYALLRVMHKT